MIKLKICHGKYAIVKHSYGQKQFIENNFKVFCQINEHEAMTSIIEETDDIAGLEDISIDGSWKLLRTTQELSFTDYGILNRILQPFADNEASVLVISSFDHDYIFTKDIEKIKKTGLFLWQ